MRNLLWYVAFSYLISIFFVMAESMCILLIDFFKFERLPFSFDPPCHHDCTCVVSLFGSCVEG